MELLAAMSHGEHEDFSVFREMDTCPTRRHTGLRDHAAEGRASRASDP